jgi:glycine betaine/choline ABC-type transport system substrate-binding protein
MQNPPNCTRRVEAKNTNYLVSMIPVASAQNQDLATISQLNTLIEQYRLTDCLEWLEGNAGITGESAIFILSWCVGGGRNA